MRVDMLAASQGDNRRRSNQGKGHRGAAGHLQPMARSSGSAHLTGGLHHSSRTKRQAMTIPADAMRAGLIPIVVGVTGHRDLRPGDLPSLEVAVRGLLERLQRRFPSTPVLIISSLAEGADRLAARVALGMGAGLVAPLPLPRAEYERDFPATVGEFAELWDDERMIHRFELPAIDVSARGSHTLPAEGRQEMQYALAGAYVARHSQVLIALWDGKDSDSVGGTAQVVGYRRTGRFGFADAVGEKLELAPEPFALPSTALDPHDTGPVYHIITPRSGHPSPDSPFSSRWLQPEHAAVDSGESKDFPAPLAATLAGIDAFNADALRLATRAPRKVEESGRQLYDGPLDEAPGSLSALRWTFGFADALATLYQRETYGVMWSIYGLALLAVVCFELYAHVFPHDDPRVVFFLAGYISILGIADIVYLVSRQRRSQNKFQDYRALAEGLRVQFFWRLAGLDHSAADFYLSKPRDELAWIREAIRSSGARNGPAREGDVRALATGWIDSQRDYFTRATRRERSRLTRYRSIAGGVILASLVWAIPTVARTLRELPHGDWPRLFQLPLLLVGVVVVWHLAFKGSQIFRGGGAGGARSIFLELRTFLVSAVLGAAFFYVVRILAQAAHARWSFVSGDAHTWTVVALTLITVAGALIHSLTEKRAFGQHARQYARMAESFTRAGDRMAALLHDGKLDRARGLAVELGKEALAEHGDWLMLHRERPIKLPVVPHSGP